MSATREILPPAVTLAIDAMGGDHAPASIIGGVEEAARLHPVAKFLLFGDEAKLSPLIAASPRLQGQCEIRHCSTQVQFGENPRNTLKKAFDDASISRAMDAVADGEAQGVVSAGDTAALLVRGIRHFGLFEGIDRPAVASYMPTLKNETMVLDLGANLSVSANNLLQFGIMGTALCEAVLALPHPRVGLLNIGIEDSKGHTYVREAAEMMRAYQWPGEFVGFLEPRDLIDGKADVVVCDGYAGNIMLKSVEAASALISGYTRAAYEESWLSRLGYMLAGRQFAKLRRRLDPRRYNGAVMAGLQQVCVKSHGSADAVSFTQAIEVAIDMVQRSYQTRLPALLAA